MSRLPAITREALTDEQRAVLENIESGPRGNMGLVGPFGVYVRVPAVGNAVQNLGAAVRFGTELSENAKEVAICTVGAFFQSKFEFAAHSSLAAKAGVSAEVIEAIRTGATPTFDKDEEAAAHEVARTLLTEHRLDDDTYERAIVVLGEQQMIELVVTVGYYCTVSFTLNAFQIPIRDDMTDPFPDQA